MSETKDLDFITKLLFENNPNLKRGILSDKSIRELCVLPESVFDEPSFNRDRFESARMHSSIVPLMSAEKERSDKILQELTQKNTYQISAEMRQQFVPMIENFVDRQVKIEGDAKKISYGLSSFGYDVRLSDKEINGKPPFVIFTNHRSAIVDPKRADSENSTIALEVHTDEDGSKYVIMPAHTYGMGYTEEVFNIPSDISVICVGKSTYARSAVFVNVTPIEAGFSGTVVIELGNSSGCPVKIYLNEGIAQFVFFRAESQCEVSYADRNGKYQGQRGVVHSKV